MPRLIVGLGNPKSSYDDTRHNVGKRFIEWTFERLKIRGSKCGPSLLFDFPSDMVGPVEKTVYGCVLSSYMNESGPAVLTVMKKEGITADQLLVLVDDFMIPFGSLRLKSKGSSGGHNGLKSIIEVLGTEEFGRLRIGIGPVPPSQDPADFVLKRFTSAENKALPDIFQRVEDGIKTLFLHDLQKAMTAINK